MTLPSNPVTTAILQSRAFDRCPDPEDAVQIFVDGIRDTDYSKFTVSGNVEYRLGSRTRLSLNAGTAAMNGTVLSGIGTIQGDDYRYSFGQARLSSGPFFAQFFVNANDSRDSAMYMVAIRLLNIPVSTWDRRSTIWSLALGNP